MACPSWLWAAILPGLARRGVVIGSRSAARVPLTGHGGVGLNDPDAFDAFYKDARTRLLVQTLALTGDLTAARSAVRDSFVMSWHHWRKLSQLDDPEAWARPHAWNHALRRAKARVWHRNKFDLELRKTLQTLGKLPLMQRKLLLLSELSSLQLPEMARELGITAQRAESELQIARTQFAVLRESTRPPVKELLLPLVPIAEEVRWPRSSILRRAGAARRRTHTTVGAAATVAALVVGGLVVSEGATARPTLSHDQVSLGAEAIQVMDPKPPAPRLAPADLLTAEQVNRLAPDATWDPAETNDNTAGDGLVLPCQQARFADPAGLGALVRRFTSTQPRPADPVVSAVQFTELSASLTAAATAYATTVGWYAGCGTPRVQLLTTERVLGVGDQAALLTLRSWNEPVQTLTVGIARTGQVTTTTIATIEGREVAANSVTSLLAASVNDICGTPGSATCAAPPTRRTTRPIDVGGAPGLISEVDLPPVGVVTAPWVGTGAEPTSLNVAASRCDQTSFSQPPITANLSRTFLITDAELPDQFGLTETVGVVRNQKQALEFVAQVREKISGCEENDLGTTVTKLDRVETPVSELDVWEVSTEVSDQQSLKFLVAIMRHRNRVAQLGFVAAPGADMEPGAFEALSARALERLPSLPRNLPPG